MARIKISTLTSVNSETSWASNSLLNELTDWEMKAVVGGADDSGEMYTSIFKMLSDVVNSILEFKNE